MTRILASLLLLLPLLASASPLADYDRMYGECLADAGATNNGTVGACAEGVSDAAKAEINALYGKLHARLSASSPADAAKLENAQKSWLSYRQLHCELAGSYVGSPMVGFCPMRLNIRRVEELRELVGD